MLVLGNNRINELSEDIFDKLSKLNTLDLYWNQLNILSDGLFSGLSQLTDLNLGNNQISVLNESVFSGLNQLNYLDLQYNNLSDNAIKNLTRSFPYQLYSLDVRYNQIGDAGAQYLAEIFPCTNLNNTYLSGNPANDTSLALAAQGKALRKVCDDQRCHANLPATESCGVNLNPSITSQITGRLFDSAGEIDKAESGSFDDLYWYWSHPAKTPSFQSALGFIERYFRVLITITHHKNGRRCDFRRSRIEYSILQK